MLRLSGLFDKGLFRVILAYKMEQLTLADQLIWPVGLLNVDGLETFGPESPGDLLDLGFTNFHDYLIRCIGQFIQKGIKILDPVEHVHGQIRSEERRVGKECRL